MRRLLDSQDAVLFPGLPRYSRYEAHKDRPFEAMALLGALPAPAIRIETLPIANRRGFWRHSCHSLAWQDLHTAEVDHHFAVFPWPAASERVSHRTCYVSSEPGVLTPASTLPLSCNSVRMNLRDICAFERGVCVFVQGTWKMCIDIHSLLKAKHVHHCCSTAHTCIINTYRRHRSPTLLSPWLHLPASTVRNILCMSVNDFVNIETKTIALPLGLRSSHHHLHAIPRERLCSRPALRCRVQLQCLSPSASTSIFAVGSCPACQRAHVPFLEDHGPHQISRGSERAVARGVLRTA